MSERKGLQIVGGLILVVAALFLTCRRSVLAEAPYLVFLAAVTLSALFAGLGPGFLATALSALLIRLFFIEPRFYLYHRGNLPDAERVCWFVLVALKVSSLVAACRRERNLLQDSEERYRILAETASDAIVVTDDRGEILFINPVAESTFGVPAEKLIGQNLAALVPENTYQAHLIEIKDHLDTRKKPVAVRLPECSLQGADMPIEMSLGAISSQGKNLFTALIRAHRST